MNTITKSTDLRLFFATAILGALAAGFAMVSAAADGMVVRSLTVKYGDLNLSNPEGATILYRRIVGAAHEVCDPPSSELSALSQTRACIDKAIADAVTKVGHPALVAIYNAKNRQPLPVTVAAR
jgi:UrcA family protein